MPILLKTASVWVSSIQIMQVRVQNKGKSVWKNRYDGDVSRINNVLIVANRKYVPVYFIFLDIDCNPTCPIILCRPFLRTIGAIIDMKEGNIRFQFPLRKGMEHFPRKKIKLPYESIMRGTYGLHTKDGNT